ncbi:MAG: radical SAM protein [Candidatus Omnitrophica bacterium CG_4_9_14_0_2_um_filter_42_8]|nr:MAG: radical SAM protein [Candidatus Omnitrophica bacterium CG_4_9_14_0_2_um_filter_42_8]
MAFFDIFTSEYVIIGYMKKFKYIYGPVYSWRLGRSLGVDPLSQTDKTCTFDCSYCQIGETKLFNSGRKVFISAEAIAKEIKALPKNVKIDYITFSGNGEPTLAKNLGDIIKRVRKIRKEKIAVITNSSLIGKSDVQEDLALADFVILKLDANAEDLFREINRPDPGIRFGDVVKGIKRFSEIYRGRLALQIMFVGKNKAYAKEIVKMAQKLGIKEVQINTPLRECDEKPLPKSDMDIIRRYFKGMSVNYVYWAKRKPVKAMDNEDTDRRHGKDKK